jgi:hypothetical protein
LNARPIVTCGSGNIRVAPGIHARGGGKRPRDFGGTIGGGVVNDDQFKRDSSLRDKRFEATREAGFLVPRGDDDGDDGIDVRGQFSMVA